MQKRQFLSAAMMSAMTGMGALPSSAAAQNGARNARGPTLLTVSGQIGAGNRGPFDSLLDVLMAKQKLSFTKAQTFDFAAITALPSITIKPTLEYDSKPHTLSGPLLTDVMKACGVKITAKTAFFLRAIDGYAAHISASEAGERRFIVATHLDGHPMALGGLGPLWALYEPDRFPDMAAKPLPDRFGSCPWATYHIEVKEEA
ncbi:MAG: molybdopterin-dependent oxidoreductase [Caldimonas sp.]